MRNVVGGLATSTVMSRAGANMLNTRNMMSSFQIGSPTAVNAKLPFSFKTALEDIEDEILALQAEVSHWKKEVKI
jgi:hypothetical protein